MAIQPTDSIGGVALGATGRYLSIDAEDIVVSAAELHRARVPQGYRSSFGSNLRRTLEVLDEAGATATVFVNGRYCDDHAALMQDVVRQGHVLATHGYFHCDVRRMSVIEFNDDLRRSLDALGKFQNRIVGYRPPAFTMPFDDEHFRVLADNRIEYVSCGALFQRANVPHHREPVRLDCGLAYVPVSMAYGPVGPPYPVGYGHVSRLLPEWFVVSTLQRIERRAGFFQFYFHPYELDGISREQKRALISVKRHDVPQRIYSLRCGDRSRLFSRILKTCTFKPIESMEAIKSG